RGRRRAVQGWVTSDDGAVRLLGTSCASCGTPLFPRNRLACRNSACPAPEAGSEVGPSAFSGRRRVWAYGDSRYQPPPAYGSPAPFVPYAVAAVELEAERVVVLGQLAPGHTVDDLAVGMEVELPEGTLYEDDEAEYTVWMWRPVP